MIHQIQHQLFQDHPQSARPYLPSHGLSGNGFQSFFTKLQPHILELEQALVLLDNSVFRARQDLDQRKFIQVLQHAYHGQAAHKLGY